MVRIRETAAAGTFYEADPAALRRRLEDCKTVTERLLPAIRPRPSAAVILPHAGYGYSGTTALATLLTVEEAPWRRYLVMAPSHRIGFRGVALADYDAFATPLGVLPLDRGAMAQLASTPGGMIGYANRAHAGEHALEVELPLLQYCFGARPLLPAVVGMLSAAEARRLAPAWRAFWNDETLWVISSDFTHYGRAFDYLPFVEAVPERLKALDLGAVDLIVRRDLDGFERYLAETGATICGANAIKLLLAVLESAGGDYVVELVHYTTSGEKTGGFSHVVSYAGVAVRRKDA